MLSRKPASVPLKLCGGRPCIDSRLIDQVRLPASASHDQTPMRADSRPERTIAAFGKNSVETPSGDFGAAASCAIPCVGPLLSGLFLSGISMPLHFHLLPLRKDCDSRRKFKLLIL